MTNEPSPLKDAIMDAVYTPLERDDMQTPCTLPFMTSSEHGVCDGDGCTVSDETIASALNAVAKIQAEYHKVKKGTQKETQKGTQKEMTDEASPRPWRVEPMFNGVADARGEKVAANICAADAALIVDAVNSIEEERNSAENCCESLRACLKTNARLEAERDRLRDLVRRLADDIERYHLVGERDRALLREASSALEEGGRS